MQTRTKESRKRLQSLILLTAFTCVLLIVSTYAWFTTQKDVNVSNIRAKVEVAEGLQISLDGGKWTQVLDLGNAITGAKEQVANASLTETTGFDYVPYEGHRNHVPSEFLPISTSGDIVDVPSGQATADVNPGKEVGMYYGKYQGNTEKKLGTVGRASELSTVAVTEDNYAGYFAFDIFLKNTSKTGVTQDTLQLNSDSYAWVLPEGEDITVGSVVYDGDSTSGLQNAIRVAFARYGEGDSTESDIVPSTALKADVIKNTANQPLTKVAIWEPNHDDHVERIITNVGILFPTTGITNPLPTSADYEKDSYTPFWTGTLKSTALGNGLDSVFDWSNTHIKQTPTLQTSTDDTLKGYTIEGVQNLITTDSGATSPSDTGDAKYEKFTLAANSITRLRVYVYLEGQDPDCDTDASVGGGIEVNIGLTKGEAQGSMDRYKEVVDETRTSYSGGSVTGTSDPAST